MYQAGIPPFLQGKLPQEDTSSGIPFMFLMVPVLFHLWPSQALQIPMPVRHAATLLVQAPCWIRSETWLGEEALWMVGCHLPTTWKRHCTGAGMQWATGAPQGQAGQSGTKEKGLSQCQPCNIDFLGSVHIVTLGTPDLANIGLIAYLHLASQLWQVKFLDPSIRCSTNASYPAKQKRFFLCSNFFHYSGQNVFLFLTWSIHFTRREVHSRGSISSQGKAHDGLAHKAIFTNKWTKISLFRVSQQSWGKVFQSQPVSLTSLGCGTCLHLKKKWGWIWTLGSKWFKSCLFILHLDHYLPMICTKDKLFFCEHTIYLNSIAQNNRSSSKKTMKHINSNNIRSSENPRYGHLWMNTTFEVNSQNCVWNSFIGSYTGAPIRIYEK